ncbi:Hypothetical protein MAGb_0380 [Mycoplasmopsis agalactiae 14628]|uniref:YgjP-like metallopeptidase domain-containing protein n=1 Tax=Mycoplasmopsis agalactiae 14628 TaxID=1110504 RepID=I5D6P7_MYCAA|nr:YgjP-like metallopeptidase domain-containing protein [Mycoplasmopsis agalactiae]EIN15356.1 Hypothetical protein MAGb_0380 [Mycoplasmopsis agalactiae 14628]
MKTNTLTELKTVLFNSKTFTVFYKHSAKSKHLKLTLYASENKVVLSAPFEDFTMENWHNFQLDNLLFKLLNRHKSKKEKISDNTKYKQIYLSYSADNHKITLFDKLVDLEWKYHNRSSYTYNFDIEQSKLQIYCNEIVKTEAEKRRKIFIYILSRILENLVTKKQTELVEKITKAGLPLVNPAFKINLKKGAWGTNIKKGKRLSKITYDVKMIAMPIRLIEAVVLHELIHEFHPNHSDKFYETGSLIMYDFKLRNKEINKIMVQIVDY